MKKFILAAIAVAAFMSCGKQDVVIDVTNDDVQEIRFDCVGWRANQTRLMEADGREMTDLWVMDYQGGKLVQQVHQVSADVDFGSPMMRLQVGEHRLCFVVSRGQNPVLDTNGHTIQWDKPSDTFHKTFALNVTPSAAAQQTVALDRVVTRLRLIVNDEIPSDAASISISPELWHTGLDYMSGEPSFPISDYSSTITLPENVRGTTGLQVSIYGMSTAARWTTNITLTSVNDHGDVIGGATIKSAPMQRNIITNCTGALYSLISVGSIVINTEWLPDVEVTW